MAYTRTMCSQSIRGERIRWRMESHYAEHAILRRILLMDTARSIKWCTTQNYQNGLLIGCEIKIALLFGSLKKL